MTDLDALLARHISSSQFWSDAHRHFRDEGVSEDHAMARADMLRMEYDKALADFEQYRAATEPVVEAAKALYWFRAMILSGGPDGSDLDQAVEQDAERAALVVLDALAGEAGK